MRDESLEAYSNLVSKKVDSFNELLILANRVPADSLHPGGTLTEVAQSIAQKSMENIHPMKFLIRILRTL